MRKPKTSVTSRLLIIALLPLFGFIYGLIYSKTKRLLPIMISHWLGDILGFSYMYFIMT